MTTRRNPGITDTIKKEYPRFTYEQVKTNIDVVMDAIRSVLKENKKLILTNFGTFEIKEQKRKEFRNPKTGKKIIKDPSIQIKFIPSKKFIKEIINDY